MIKSISYENINGRSIDLEFPEGGVGFYQVCGANGTGKTTLIDAMAFALTGLDSRGVALPVHLISNDKDRLSVSVDLGKSIIQRTLTRKKSQTLKLVRGEAPPVALTQEDLTKLTCSRNALLSGMVSGFFMTLPQEKASEVLREITEAVDRWAILEGIYGGPITEDYRVYLDLTKPSHTAATKLVAARRDLGKQLSNLEGRLQANEAVSEPGDEPQKPAEDYEAMERAKRRWDAFRRTEASIATAKAQLAATVAKNDENRHVREELEQAIADLTQRMPPEPMGWKVQPALLEKKALPQKPLCMELPASGSCPTCGQVVGLKHRESIEALNAKLVAEYDAAVAEISKWNGEVDAATQAVAEKRRAADVAHRAWTTECARIEAEREKIRLQLSRIVDATPPAIPEAAEPPEVPEPSNTDFIRASHANNEYLIAKGAWESKSGAYRDARKNVDALRVEVERLKSSLDILEKIEAAVGKLDEAIFEATKHIYTLHGGLRLVLKDGSFTVENPATGLTYWQFSKGQRMAADMRLAEKIATSLPRPVKFLFIDDADLVSSSGNTPGAVAVETVVFSKVTENPLEIKKIR